MLNYFLIYQTCHLYTLESQYSSASEELKKKQHFKKKEKKKNSSSLSFQSATNLQCIKSFNSNMSVDSHNDL